MGTMAESMIQSLMDAEKTAAALIDGAKAEKAKKVKQAVEDADKRIKDYKAQLEGEMESDIQGKIALEKELDNKRDANHNAMKDRINAAFNSNKDATIDFIVKAVKEVDLDSCLTETQKDCLMKEGQ